MGIQFPDYMILYIASYFGREPSHASRRIVSSLLLQFVDSFPPKGPYVMGPEGFRAYEYVEDGAFAEPWLDVRPWTSVRIWEVGLETCLWTIALRAEKKEAEGSLATRSVLWGLTLCAVEGAISLPVEKHKGPQEFLSQSCFDRWVARIPLEV